MMNSSTNLHSMSEPQLNGGVLKALACNLTTISDLPASILSKASTITEANFSFNELHLDSLADLVKFTSLETLVLDNNELASLRNLPPLPSLQTLWLNNNSLDEIEDVVGSLAKQCPKLNYLSLLRNPCCPNELMGKGEIEYRRYRIYAKYRIPSLNKLDALAFTADEANEAREKGKFLHTAVAAAAVAGGGGAADSAKVLAGVPEDDEDMFARFEKKLEASGEAAKHSGPYFTQQRHFYSGKTSEGNRFIKDDIL